MLKTYNSKVLHQTLKMYNEYKCSICSNNGIWNNQPLRLQVDHIDGNNSNNEIENLRFVCPNCHSQTDTFTGRNAKTKLFIRPSKEEFMDLYKKYTAKEISLLKAVSLRVVYHWFKFYIKEDKVQVINRKLSCDLVVEIKDSTEASEKIAPRFNVSGKLIRQIRRGELYKSCN